MVKEKAKGEAEDTKTLLLKAARKLFAEKGFDGTSVKELCDEAGVNSSLVSYFFDGKEGLYRECLEPYGVASLEMAKRVLVTPKSTEEFRVRVEMFFGEMCQSFLRDPEVAAILHRECSMNIPHIQDLFRETFMQIFFTFLQFIKESQKAGVIRRDVDPAIAGRVFFGSLTNAFHMDRMSEKNLGVSLKEEKFRTLFLSQLLDFTMRSLGV